MRLMSILKTVCTWALVRLESTMRWGMMERMRVKGTSSSPAVTTGAGAGAAGLAAAGADAGTGAGEDAGPGGAGCRWAGGFGWRGGCAALGQVAENVFLGNSSR